MDLRLEPARRAPRAHARADLRDPRRRAAVRDRGRRRDPRGGAARGLRRARDAGRRARLQVGRVPRRQREPGSLRRAQAGRPAHSVGQARRRGREGARGLRGARRIPTTCCSSRCRRSIARRSRRRGSRRSRTRGSRIAVYPLERDELPRGSPRASRGRGSASRRRRSRFSPTAARATCSPRGRRSRSSRCCCPKGELAHDDVERAVADVARYDVFELSEAWLGGRRRARAAHHRRARSRGRRRRRCCCGSSARTSTRSRRCRRPWRPERPCPPPCATRASGASGRRRWSAPRGACRPRVIAPLVARARAARRARQGHRPRQRLGRAAHGGADARRQSRAAAPSARQKVRTCPPMDCSELHLTEFVRSDLKFAGRRVAASNARQPDVWQTKAAIPARIVNGRSRPRLCENAKVAEPERLPILEKVISSERQHEAICRRRGPKPGDVAAGVS